MNRDPGRVYVPVRRRLVSPSAERNWVIFGSPDMLEKGKTLDMYNQWAFLLHFVSAVCLIALTVSNDTWPVYATTMHPDWEPCNPADRGKDAKRCDDTRCRITMRPDVVGTVPLEWLVFAFHMLSVIAHASNRWFYRETYLRWLCRKMNPGRWVEYFFSASIMQTVIMVLTGFLDIWTLCFSTVMIAVTQIFGHVTEQVLFHARKSPLAGIEKWQYFFYGWVSFIPPWFAIYYSFYWAVLNTKGAGPPDWVQGIVWSLLIVFTSFAVVMVWFLRNWSRPDVSFRAEKIYCILSFISKTILTWQLYFGAFSRAQNDLVAFDPRNVTDSC